MHDRLFEAALGIARDLDVQDKWINEIVRQHVQGLFNIYRKRL